MSCTSVARSLAELFVEILDKVFTDKVCPVIVVAVFRELALNLKVCDKTSVILYGSNLCILDCRQRVDSNREARYAECHQTLNVCVVKRHHKSLISVFIVHIVNDIHGVDIKSCHPRKILLICLINLFKCKGLFLKDFTLGSYLCALDFVLTAVKSHKENLCKVTSCTEELHLLTHLHCRYAASDCIVVAVHSSHYVVVLILNRVRINRNLSAEVLKCLRKSVRPKNRNVRLSR